MERRRALTLLLFAVVMGGVPAAAQKQAVETHDREPDLVDVIQLESLSALKALTNRPRMVSVSGYYSAHDGGGGTFEWFADDNLQADDGLTVKPSAGPPGRYKRIASPGLVQASWFGARCDWNGKTGSDDTRHLQAALDAVGTRGGGRLLIPKGGCVFTSLAGRPGVYIEGLNAFSSVLVTSSRTATAMKLPTSSGLTRLKVMSATGQSEGFLVDITGNGVLIDDCEFEGYYIGINVGTIGVTQIVNPRIYRSTFRSAVTELGSGALQFVNFSNAVVDGVVVTGPTSGVQPNFGIRYQNGDTAFLSNTNVFKHGKGLLVDPPLHSNTYALSISNSLFDSAGTIASGVSVPSAEIAPGGGVSNANISNTWFGLSAGSSGLVVAPTGAGFVDGLFLTNPQFMANAVDGMIVIGAGVNNWGVSGGSSAGNSRGSGIRVAGATSGFVIAGHRAGDFHGRGPNNWGITVEKNAAANNYLIVGNNLTGNTKGGLFDGGVGPNKVVANNL